MKRRLFKSILSLFLCLSMILVPINAYASGDTGKSVIETPSGNIIITESDTIRTAEMTDAEGNIIKTIFNKQTQEAQIYVNGIKSNFNNTSIKKAPPVSASEKVIGNYKRRSSIDTYAYATLDIEQTIVWQGLAKTSYVWRVTGIKEDMYKEIITRTYAMPAAFGDMMLAIDDLNNKVSEVLALGIGLGLTAGVILGAIELGLDAAATLLAAAGAGADLTMLLYGVSGIQGKLDACEVAYQKC